VYQAIRLPERIDRTDFAGADRRDVLLGAEASRGRAGNNPQVTHSDRGQLMSPHRDTN
jgi:hypothetical protein